MRVNAVPFIFLERMMFMLQQSLREFLLRLHYVMPVPINRFWPLLMVFQHTEEISVKQLTKFLKITTPKATQLQKFLQEHQNFSFSSYYKNQEIEPITFFDTNYPENLRQIYDPPSVIYTKGKLDILQNQRKIAVVGSRKASKYSKDVLEHLLPSLVNEEFVVVSGLAKGADKMAHDVTMKLGGATIGVLGYGFQHIYPREHGDLMKEMSQTQLLISEYPPYMGPKKWQFPMRNRLISGISWGILVTEAQKKSGTLSTVDYGLDHGRMIFVIPGNILSPLSELPHKLASEGATLVWNGSQILEEMADFLFLK